MKASDRKTSGQDEREIRLCYERITRILIERGLTITVMESCTGGLIASLLTDTEGASATLRGAFVTYSNEAKIRQGVPATVIDTHGIYSAETAAAMASACREAYHADIGIGVTGSAGNPDPANADSRPGEVFFSINTAGRTQTRFIRIAAADNRAAFKLAVADALGTALLSGLSSTAPTH